MTSLNISLFPWQQAVWEDKARFKVVAAGRRTGKSRLAAYKLIVNALQANKGHVFYVAPTQGQARDIMWQTLLEVGHPVISGSHINNLQIKLINGATISLKGADRPETMRGVSLKYLVMDEYADMKPSVWEQILRPALALQMRARQARARSLTRVPLLLLKQMLMVGGLKKLFTAGGLLKTLPRRFSML